MTVKGLLKFLRDLDPAIVQTLKLSEMKGYRICVDVAVLTYAAKSIFITRDCQKKDLIFQDVDYVGADQFLLTEILRDFSGILNAGCCPVAVFDGPAPDLKTATKKDRSAKSEKRRYRIAELRRIGKALLDPVNPFVMTQEDYIFLNSFKKGKLQIKTLEDLRKRLLTEIKGLIVVTSQDYARMKILFSAMGIACVTAISEAEQTCAQMARHKHVMAAYTTDSDCLIYGCPIMISKMIFSTNSMVATAPTVKCYQFVNCLKITGLTHVQWIQFCIMNGTDFNPNIPGYGPTTNHKLLLQFGSIFGIMAARDNLKRHIEQTKWSTLKGIDRELVQFDESYYNLDQVRVFLTLPCVYDETRLSPTVDIESFDRTIPGLKAIMGEKNWPAIEKYCRQMMGRLKDSALMLRH